MKLEVELKASTPKETVSSMREVLAQGRLSYQERIDLVAKLLKEASNTPSADIQLEKDKAEIRQILYPQKTKRPYRRKVYQYDLDMHLVAVHESIRKACGEFNVYKPTITGHANLFGTIDQKKPFRGMFYFTWEENRPKRG